MQTAVGYVRKIDGKEVFFGHSGKLYHQSFSMYEKKTDSEFTGVHGVGITGKYRGVVLQQYPSVLTTWGEWKKLFPKTKVMQGRSRGGMMGTYVGHRRPAGLILALDVDGKSIGYNMSSLAAKKIVNNEFNKRKIVWVALDSGTQLVLERKVGSKVLTFGKGAADSKGREILVDKETESKWLALTGKCIKGKMKGKQLNMMTTTPFKQRQWSHFHRKAKLLK
jgi:hypothetical protein